VKKFNFSIHTILGLIIGFMGLLSLIFALVSGAIHQNHAFENQRISMRELIRIKSIDQLDELAIIEHKLGLALLGEPIFRKAYSDKNLFQLNKILYNEYNRYYVSTDQIKLEKLTIFSLDFEPIAEKSSETSLLKDGETGCPELFEQAKQRKGAKRLKIMSALCFYDKRPYHATILPIGGLRVAGYVIITSDPVHNLIPIEAALGMPVTIKTYDGNVPYKSKLTPDKENIADIITAEYILHSDDNKPAVLISVSDKVRPLFKSLPDTRKFVMISTTLITLFFIFLVTIILRRTTINPLNMLAQQLHLVCSDRNYLGKTVDVDGTAEIRELGNNFNQMSTELGGLYNTLEEMAYTDDLTKLANRNMFQKYFNTVIQEYNCLNQPFALLLMDLDRFKTINDTLGHHIGDKLLSQVALRLEKIFQKFDAAERIGHKYIISRMIARLGGDEFAAIISMQDSSELEQEIKSVAESVVVAMKEPFYIDKQQLVICISIGIVLCPLHGDDKNELMRKADVTMYHAKRIQQGFDFYNDSHDEYSIRYLTLSHDLHNAIGKNQLVLNYQPKIDARSGAVCGAEALVRWEHPDLGLIGPDDFIPMAEQTGLIHTITNWILNKAMEECSKWQQGSGYNHGVSINLSAINLHNSQLPDDIASLIARHSLSAESITLEITESAIMSDPEYALEILTRLRNMQLSLSIDDFGTGYSSLSYVKKLPVNEIKIDKSFVDDICSDSNDEAIIRSIVVLSNHMQMKVVAEGVEDLESYNKLQVLDCDIIQGHYIARPMSFNAFMEWLGNKTV